MTQDELAAFNNYYLSKEAFLLGRSLPIETSAEVFPAPAPDTIAMRNDLNALLQTPAFAAFFAFMRQENERTATRLKAADASDSALRCFKADQEYLEKAAKAVVSFVAEVDRNAFERAKWLESQGKTGQTTTSANTI